MVTDWNPDDLQTVEQAGEAFTPETVRTPDLLQGHYLGLLERVNVLKKSYEIDPSQQDWLMKAINLATYAAFRSCVDVGMEDEARGVLAKEPDPA